MAKKSRRPRSRPQHQQVGRRRRHAPTTPKVRTTQATNGVHYNLGILEQKMEKIVERVQTTKHGAPVAPEWEKLKQEVQTQVLPQLKKLKAMLEKNHETGYKRKFRIRLDKLEQKINKLAKIFGIGT